MSLAYNVLKRQEIHATFTSGEKERQIDIFCNLLNLSANSAMQVLVLKVY